MSPLTYSIVRMNLLGPIGLGVPVVIYLWLLWNTPQLCMETPTHRATSDLLAFYKEGMNKTTVYIKPRLYRNVTDAISVADRHVARAAQAHIGTRQAHLRSLGEIGRELQEANLTLQTAINRRARHPSSEQELDNFEIKLSLNNLESKLATFLSKRKSLIQQQDGTAFNRAQAKVATALDSIDNFAQDKERYGASFFDTVRGDYTREGLVPLPGFPSENPEYRHHLRKNAAAAHMKGAYKAGKKLLALMEDWKPLNAQTDAEWDTIEAWMREHKQHTDSLDPEVAVRNLWDVLRGSLDNLAKEMEVFMETWGPRAGYRWEEVEKGGRNKAGAVPCKKRGPAPGAQEDDGLRMEPDAA